MSDYIIMTDSSCDLPAELAEKMELSVLPLYVDVDGRKYVNYLDEREIAFSEIYAKLRTKCPAKTSAVNVNDFMVPMENALKAGRDVLYIGFSSGLSSTYDAGAMAARELSERYPGRKIYTVDSLCASMGQGLLVYLAWKQKQLGRTLEQVRDYVEDNKLHLCHWFTIDDLMFLKRGGRCSPSSAFFGSMLSIKPVLHVSEEGRLVARSKVRGRRQALRALAQKFGELEASKDQWVFISHGDCEADALQVKQELVDAYGCDPEKIVLSFVGPVIGSHAGPGTVALFFRGKDRG